MSETRPKWDFWKLPTLLLWMVFFGAGLAPGTVFEFLRIQGNVLVQNALINSSHMITIALAGYLAMFVFNRCLMAGTSSEEAQDKAIQVAIFAWIAFLPLDFGDVRHAYANPLLRNRTVIYFAAAMKLTAWWLLLSMMLRYYLLRGEQVFSNMICLFPGTKPASDTSEPDLALPGASCQEHDGSMSDFIPDTPSAINSPPDWPSRPTATQKKDDFSG